MSDAVGGINLHKRIGINKWYQSFALRNFDLEDMEFESANSNTTAKLPILKLAQENGTSVTTDCHVLQYNDAKTMFAAIETRFGGNEANKKTHKKLLKQQYENFSASSTESLDSIFNRLQKIISSTSGTNDTANNAYEVSYVSPMSACSPQQDLEQIHEDDLEAMDLKWQLSLLSMRAKRYFQRTGKKIFINANDTARYDKSKAMLAIDGVGFDWSDMAEEQVQTNMALMAFSDSEGKPLMDDKGFVDSGCLRHMTGNIAYLSDFKKFDGGYVTFDGREHMGKPLMDDKGFVDSGCSRHMTENIAYLTDFKEFDGGYVTFGGGAHGGKISGKGTLKTDSLDFEDVYFVNELKFNLFSVSQMCDKKNYVLFTDTEYESMLWHRRLGHINFKNINKLVKDNLVRGLPTKRFENDQTCVAHSLGKFDGKSNEGFFVGYSLSSKAFRVYNTRTRRVKENLHIGFLENKPMIEGNGPKWLFDIDSLNQSMNYVPVAAGTIINESACTQGEFNVGTSEEISQDCIVMPIWEDASYFDSPSNDVDFGKPKYFVDDQKQVEDGLDNENDEKDKSDDDCSPKEVNAAGQHVNTASPDVNTGSFKLNTVDPSVNTASSYDQDSPKDMFTMGASHTLEATHVEFFHDKDEPKVDLGNITNPHTVPTTPNTRIHKDHPIENVIGDVKSSVQTRRMTKPTSEQGFLNAIEPTSIAKALSDSSWVEAMQVIDKKKSAFLYGTIEEEVYVTQPSGFKDPNHPDKVYKVYVDDIIFGSTNKELCTGFEKLMKDKFQMSSIGELTFFLGLQVQQKEDGIFISQSPGKISLAEILKKFKYTDVKYASTPVDLEKPLVKDGDANDVDVHLYRSMFGSLMYLTASRPDIIVCSKFMSQIQVTLRHLISTVKRFLDIERQTNIRPFKRGCTSQLKLNMLVAAIAEDSTLDSNQCWIMVTATGLFTLLGIISAARSSLMLVEGAFIKQLNQATSKANTVNGKRQLQDLVDKKRVIITESSIRTDLHLEDAGAFGEYVTSQKIYVNPSHIKKIFANMKREGKDFSRRVTPIFATMMVQATQDEGVDSGIHTDSQSRSPITTQPSSSRP
ncbi:putative ribonuclease H-like domain-containing protein [Tanacetum coccineum]